MFTMLMGAIISLLNACMIRFVYMYPREYDPYFWKYSCRGRPYRWDDNLGFHVDQSGFRFEPYWDRLEFMEVSQ